MFVYIMPITWVFGIVLLMMEIVFWIAISFAFKDENFKNKYLKSEKTWLYTTAFSVIILILFIIPFFIN